MSENADQFERALRENAPAFDVRIDDRAVADLRDYFSILDEWNPRLHLVAPCSPEELATRHVLESLVALRYIEDGANVWDIGSGGGLPIIPCLIVRPDIQATLIESSPKKAVFLREALRVTNTSDRAKVIAERFEKIALTDANVVTSRALDHFQEMFTTIVRSSPSDATLLLFSGNSLRAEIEREGLTHTTLKIPESDQRFIFIISGQYRLR